MEEREYYSLPEVAEKIGISRQAVFARVKRKTINAIMVGKRYLVSKEALSNLMSAKKKYKKV